MPTRADSVVAVTHHGLSFHTIGDARLLDQRLLGLFCSIRCPGKLILQCYDLAQALRDAGVPVIGGFHTPMEREALELLLKGKQPLVICPARGLARLRVPAPWQAAIDAGRLLLASPFGPQHRRATAERAETRNEFVAALASEILVIYAAPGGKTEAMCRRLIAAGKPVLTLPAAENENLVALRATPWSISEIVAKRSALPG